MSGQILLFLGGTSHDFDGFSDKMGGFFEQSGWSVERTWDPDRLSSLSGPDAVLQYTGLGNSESKGQRGPELTPAQTKGLVGFVRAGGGLLSAHCATVISEENPELARLHGGRFLSHPPQFDFCVYPLSRPHPITEDLPSFVVHDELYYQEVASDVQIHAVAFDRGIAHPMLWTREEGTGRIVHVAPGHGPLVWAVDAYRRLMLQALEWAAGRR
jgi:type 1 glutamine amidotransferase